MILRYGRSHARPQVWCRGKKRFKTAACLVYGICVWRKVGNKTSAALDKGQAEVRSVLG